MRIGANVRGGGDLVGIVARTQAIEAEVAQVFTQSSRAWRPTHFGRDVLDTYRAAQADAGIVTYCHATYLINLATGDPALLERSRACLVANLAVATGMGASGLVLHVGSHRGRGFDACTRQVADALLFALGAVGEKSGAGHPTACSILLENSAGAGGMVGRTLEDLAVLLDVARAGDALGVCLDTQHLWASGTAFGSPDEADDVVRTVGATVGLRSLRCVHLNDSKVPLGANRDHHENLGVGAIGEKALGCLVAHPALSGCDVVLEVPGAGHGPRLEDVRAARRIVRAGRDQWAAAATTGRWSSGAGVGPAQVCDRRGEEVR